MFTWIILLFLFNVYLLIWSCLVFSMIFVRLSKNNSLHYCLFFPSSYLLSQPIYYPISFGVKIASFTIRCSISCAILLGRVDCAIAICTVFRFFLTQGRLYWDDQQFHPTWVFTFQVVFNWFWLSKLWTYLLIWTSFSFLTFVFCTVNEFKELKLFLL